MTDEEAKKLLLKLLKDDKFAALKNTMIDGEPMQWYCEQCGKLRDDQYISVVSVSVDNRVVGMTHNIRYCNDKAECIRSATTQIAEITGVPEPD